MPDLVVFDIDGTLINNKRYDEQCFLSAMESTLGIRGISTDWLTHPIGTDAGILRELFSQYHGRAPSAPDVESFIGKYLRDLEGGYLTAPEEYAPIPGTRSLIQTLREDTSWIVAIATGGWAASALLKLRLARIPAHDLPFASSNDSSSREEIVRTAIQRATEQASIDSFERTVLVGDALWDVQTARNLVLPFMGIGKDAQADQLLSAGATSVLPDFRDIPAVLQTLGSATVPHPE